MSYQSDFDSVFSDQTLLGETPIKPSRYTVLDIELYSTAYRINENHRFQGVREAFKFNRSMDNMVSFAYWFTSLSNSVITTNQTIYNSFRIADSVLTKIVHALRQLEYGSYVKLKSRAGRWY